MPESTTPSAIAAYAGRAFSFYPAIRNVEYNQWTFVRETWSEVLVANSRSGESVWIPRRLLGKTSSADEPVLIVGLKKELELKGGAVWPYERAVIEMPPARPAAEVASAPPPEAPGRMASATESKAGWLILYVVLGGLGVTLLVVIFAFQGAPQPRQWFRSLRAPLGDQQYLSLTDQAGYHEVARRLGRPEREQWITPESAELHFQVLWYPQRSFAIVLMGSRRESVRYIGAIHAATRSPLDSVKLPGGGSTAAMLRNLPKF